VERGSVQHGARLDDELAEGTEGRTTGAPVSARERDDLDPEAPTSDELDLTTVRPDLDTIAPGEFIARSELARWLLPSTFPGSAAELLEAARSLAAPEDVLVLLEQLDPAAHFEAFGELWRALGGTVETRGAAHEVEVEADEPEAPVDDRAEELADAVADAVERGIDAPAPADAEPEPLVVIDVTRGGRDLVAVAVGIALTPVRVAVAVVREVARVGSRVVHDR
jgi:hypothetical protein